MRIVFLGSGEFGLPTLAFLRERHQVAAVVSQPDRPAGRRRHLTPTPIAQWALDAGMNVIRTDNANQPDIIRNLRDLRPDAGIVVAFGQKLGPELLGSLGRLVVNLHASLLPKYRGAAPINWAIINGERETGVCVIALAQRMDAGDVYAAAATQIDPMETAGELHDRLAALGPGVMEKVLEDLEHGRLNPQAQDEALATRAPKLSKADGWVDFAADAKTIQRRVHGLTPWPGVTVRWRSAATGDEQALKLLRVAAEDRVVPAAAPGTVLESGCVAAGRGVIALREVQLPGGKAMPVDEFLKGHALVSGDQFIGGPNNL